VSSDVCNSLGSYFSKQFGFQIDFRDRDELARIDEFLLAKKRPQPKNDGAVWPEIISNDIKPDRRVVGRDEVLDRLRHSLVSQTGEITTAMLLRGQAGVGKTTIAREYVKEFRHSYKGVWWCRSDDEANLVEDLCRLGDRLGLRPWNYDQPKDRALAAVELISQSIDAWLLVYDNANSPRLVGEFLSRSRGTHTLVTTREGGWPATKFIETEIGVLGPAAAKELLFQESERREVNIRGLEALAVDGLDGLPLAIVHAGAWLKDTPSATAEDYSRRLDEIIKRRPDTAHDYPASVYGSIMLSVDKLTDRTRLAANIMSFWAPDHLAPEYLLAANDKHHWNEAFGSIPASYVDAFSDLLEVQQQFAELCRRSLLNQQGSVFGMHRLTQRVIRSALDDDVSEVGRIATAILTSSYPPTGKVYEERDRLAQLAPHTAWLIKVVTDSAELGKLVGLAWYHFDFQRDDHQALACASRALQLAERHLGPEHFEVGVASNNLAISYWRLRDIREAEKHAARAAAIAEGVALKRVDHGIWLSVHGIILMAAAEHARGVKRQLLLRMTARRHLQALVIFFAVSATRKSRQVGTCLVHLANLRALQGRWEAALRLHGRSLSIRTALLQGSDPDLAFSYVNTGITLLESGRGSVGYRNANAIDYLQIGLRIREEAFAERMLHPERIKAALWLARAHVVLQGGAVAGVAAPNLLEAQRICQRYDLDFGEVKRSASTFIRRKKLYERGQKVPPTIDEREE
jgi:DNA polymerase III delta prime subunit